MLTATSSDSARAAPLDGALSFSILMQNQRDLTLQYAQSGVSGLLGAIQQSQSDYAPLLQAVQSALEVEEQSVERLTRPLWAAASPAELAALTATLDASFHQALAAQQAQLDAVRAQIAAAQNNTVSPSPERTAASALDDAAALLQGALDQLQSGNSSSAAASLALARDAVQAARADAVAQLALLNNQNPVPTARVNATQAVIAAADALSAAIDATESLATSSLAAARGEIAQGFKLNAGAPPDTYLTTWGDSGTVSLTDASGRGVLISADGRVDSLPRSGSGWQFQTDTTFLLGDGTKVTIVPGNPARLLATRGEQQLSIANFSTGTPHLAFSETGGVKSDADTNDGTLVTVGADLRAWTLAGAPLGDESSREVVATVKVTNERLVDITNVSLPAALVDQLTALGVDPSAYDTNHDGLFSRRELQELTTRLDTLAADAVIRFDQALSRTSSAIGPLVRLNQFLNRIVAQAERRQSQHAQVTAAERDELLAIQREIESARNALRSQSADTLSPTNVVATAKVVLNQIERIGEVPPASPATTPNAPESSTPPAPGTTPLESASALPSTLDQSLRRAQRVLTGFAIPPAFRTVDSGEPTTPLDVSLPTPPRPGAEPVTDSEPRSTTATPKPRSVPRDETPAVPREREFRDATPVTPLPGRNEAPSVAPVDVIVPDAKNVAPPPSQAATRIAPTGTPVNVPAATGVEPPVVSGNERPEGPALRDRPAPETTAQPNPRRDVGAEVPNVFSDAFSQELRRRLEQHWASHRDHVTRKQDVQIAVRQAVEQFVTVVMNDDQLRQAFHADDLSDDQVATYRTKIQTLERETGLAWGGDLDDSPRQDAALQARVLKSGLMI